MHQNMSNKNYWYCSIRIDAAADDADDDDDDND